MSDILIKGMEMPKSCYACMFFAQTDYWNKEDEAEILSRCKRTGEKTWESVNGYLPNCPLVPVPPHGRLVDMGEIEERIDSCCDDIDCSKTMCNECAVQIVMNKVFDAPTIIPASGGKEDE